MSAVIEKTTAAPAGAVDRIQPLLAQIAKEEATATAARKRQAEVHAAIAKAQVAVDAEAAERAQLSDLRIRRATTGDASIDKLIAVKVAEVEAAAVKANDARAEIADLTIAGQQLQQLIDDADGRVAGLRGMLARAVLEACNEAALASRRSYFRAAEAFARDAYAKHISEVMALQNIAKSFGVDGFLMVTEISTAFVAAASAIWSWSPSPGKSVLEQARVSINVTAEVERAAVEVEARMRSELGI